MKKAVIALAALLLVLSVCTVSVFAAGARSKGCASGNAGHCPGQNYADEDQDGICDNRPAQGCPAENRGGFCTGPGYADENRDGICDNRDGSSGCPDPGQSAHHGNGHGHGRRGC